MAGLHRRRIIAVLLTLFSLALSARAQDLPAKKFDLRLRHQHRVAPRGLAPLGGGPAQPAGFADVFLKLRPDADPDAVAAAAPGVRILSRHGQLATARVPLAALSALAADGRVERVQAAQKGRPKNDVVRSETTVAGPLYLGVFGGSADPLAGVTADGSGVIVGIVDTGIDYKHEDFMSGTFGTGSAASRILAIWDQTDGGGPTPATVFGAAYPNSGSAWTQAQINNEIDGTPAGVVREQDTNGHGTHVAGSAAGDGSATGGGEPAGKYKGMAPGADIIAVKTTFNDTDVCSGLIFISSRAAALGKKAVANLSLGFAFGSHDGQDYIDACVDDAVTNKDLVVVAANGNEGSSRTHATWTNTASNELHSYNVVDYDGNSLGNNREFYIELWHESADAYKVSVSLPGGPPGSTVFVTSNTTQLGLTLGTASIDIDADLVQSGSRRVTAVYVNTGGENPSGVRVNLQRVISGGSGRVDGYISDDYGLSVGGFQFSSDFDYAGTVGIPASANKALSVGAYASKMCWVNALGSNICYTVQEPLGGIASFSSRGPTRDGRQKPDITAPGFGVASSRSSNMPAPPVNNQLLTGKHWIDQGTSMASPVVAGWAALARQTFPSLTATQIKARAMADARVDGAVAVGNTWGSGKVAVALRPRSAPATTSAQLVAASSTTQIQFTWSSVSDASAYDLYYGTDQFKLHAATVTSPYTFTTTPNQVMGFLVRARNAAGTQPTGSLTPFVATLAVPYGTAPQVAPAVTPHISSMTVNYTALPGQTSGYYVEASTASNFTGTIFRSTTAIDTQTQLKLTGLASSTSYYVRLANLNKTATPNYGSPYGPYMTNNSLVRPDPAPFSGVAATSIQQNWLSGGNGFGTNYRAKAFSDAARTTQVGSDGGGANVFSSVFSGLSPATTYWFRVTPEQGAITGPSLDEGPQATLAAAPAPAATPLVAFSATSLQAVFTTTGGGAQVFDVQASQASDFSSGVTSVWSPSTTVLVSGLTANAVYYARVRARSYDGTPTAWVSLGSIQLLSNPPNPTGFSNQTAYGFTAAWDNGGNSGAATYRVWLSLTNLFNRPDDIVLDVGAAQQYAFSGLLPNRQYFYQVAAYNAGGVISNFGASASTFTVPAPPGNAATAVLSRGTGSIQFAWAAGPSAGLLNPAGTQFQAEIHAASDFSDAAIQSVTTVNLNATFNVGLAQNTIYYARVRALGSGSNGPSAWTALGSGSTLAAPFGAAPTVVDVKYRFATLAWSACPAAPQSASCEGYRVEASTDSLFRGTLYSNLVADKTATSGSVTGLPPNTVLYVRAGPVNWDSAGNPTAAAGSITTLPENSVTTTVGGAGGTATVTPLLPPLTQVSVDVPPGAFPAGTVVTLNSSIEFSLPAPITNEARLVSAGAASGFEISAQGRQPANLVRVTASYNPASLPASVDPRTLQVARYDDTAGQWTLEPTFVDTANKTISAELRHFSLFGVFGVQAASELEAVQIFPIPWEINTHDPLFSASALTISNVPPNARVRIFTITGELVWEGPTAANGVLSWRGDNKHGGKAGTGTYLVVIEGAGRRVVKRAVIVR